MEAGRVELPSEFCLAKNAYVRIPTEVRKFVRLRRIPYRTIRYAKRDGITPGMDLTRVRPPMLTDRSPRETLYLGKRQSGLPRKGFK